MNRIEQGLKKLVQEAVKAAFDLELDLSDIVIEVPKYENQGDYATNVAMRLTKELRQNPKVIAEAIVSNLKEEIIEKAEIAGAGFINLYIKQAYLAKTITDVLNQDEDYGKSDTQHPLRYNVEYVSANPTGDLHPGHARGAASGDSITRIMKMAGYDVTREYYLNDAGNQIANMAKSLQARYLQRCGIAAEVPQEDGYHGQDLIEIADEIYQEIQDKYKDIPLEESLAYFREVGLIKETEKLKRDLALFRVEFDTWTSEQSLYDSGAVEEALVRLKESGHTYEMDGALWLRTSDYGDDKDRVLIKSDGSYTYLTPDIAYHLNKFGRGYDKLINLLGADHHGYIARLQASMMVFGYKRDDVQADFVQMAKMIKDGQEFKLSKRTGQAIALRDLIEEAGIDALRYYFVSKAGDAQMEVDLDMATSQSNENPVYYAQYAHARMCSILRQDDKIETHHFDLLSDKREWDLIKLIADFPQAIQDSARLRQAHLIPAYIQKLASGFHSFYQNCPVLKSERPLKDQRLALVKATQITLRNALQCIAVNPVERM